MDSLIQHLDGIKQYVKNLEEDNKNVNKKNISLEFNKNEFESLNKDLVLKLSHEESKNKDLFSRLTELDITNNLLNKQLESNLKLDKILSKIDNVELNINKVVNNEVDKIDDSKSEKSNGIIKFYDFELEKANNELSLKNKKIISLQKQIKELKDKDKGIHKNTMIHKIKSVIEEVPMDIPLVEDKRLVEKDEFILINNVETEKEMLTEINNTQINENHIINVDVFTDGSCLNNGSKTNAKAGLGVHFPKNDYKLEDISKPCYVNKGSVTNNIAELMAIKEALISINSIVNKGNNHNINNISLYSDSEYSIKILTKVNKYNSNKVLIEGIFNTICMLSDNNIDIKFIHVKAHTDNSDYASLGNKMADELANKGSLEYNSKLNPYKKTKTPKTKVKSDPDVNVEPVEVDSEQDVIIEPVVVESVGIESIKSIKVEVEPEPDVIIEPIEVETVGVEAIKSIKVEVEPEPEVVLKKKKKKKKKTEIVENATDTIQGLDNKKKKKKKKKDKNIL